MKKKKKSKGIFSYIFIIVFLLFVAGCGLSFLSDDFFSELRATVTKTVVFDNGSFPMASTDICVALNSGETAKLRSMTNLRTADFSGSEDHEEIIKWASEHPQVDVTYSVPLPDGSTLSSKTELADFSGVTSETLPQYAAKLPLLTNVKTVILGSSESGSALTPEEIKSLRSQYPDIAFSYKVPMGAQLVDISDSSLDLRSLKPEELSDCVKWLGCMKNLKTVELGSEDSGALTLGDIAKIADVCPEAKLNYSFTLYGVPMNLDAEVIDINHIPVTDNGEAVVNALKCMKNCKKLDMDYCGVEDLRMEEIRDMFPDTEVVWRIWFGDCYSVRTDVERILASKPSVGGMLDNSVNEKLKYCTRVKYLDLGHNDTLTDISFVRYMPDLEVFIIAINTYITDISPLAFCEKLEYLELNTTPVADLSPLSGLTGLHHVNIGCTQVRDISPLFSCKDMERLWIGLYTEIPAEQIIQMQQIAPNCVINTTTDDPHGESWRYNYHDVNTDYYDYVPRYKLLREQLGYGYSEYAFYWKDPLCGDPCPPQYAGTADGILEKPADA